VEQVPNAGLVDDSLPQPLQVPGAEPERVDAAFRSLGSENWSIHEGLNRLSGTGSQVFESVGGLLGDGSLGKHDDRKQVPRRQYAAIAQYRFDSVGNDKVVLGWNVGTAHRLGNIEGILGFLGQVTNQHGVGTQHGAHIQAELTD
jgi:hypothetical protein